jgi:hypothetical protein
MPLSNLTNIIFGRYLKRNVPEDADIPASFRKYLSDEFQSIETNLQEHSEANPQAADSEPHRPRKGMLRYAVAPWNPLGNNYQGLVVYTGSAWQAVQGGSGGGGGSNTEVNDLSASVTWVNVPNANITQSSVTQHQAALSITESQISDLQSYLTSEANDLSTTVTWADVPDANITQSSVTQHQSALSITESQISDLGTYLTSHQDISGKADLSGASFTGDVSVGTDKKLSVGELHSVTGTRNITGGYENTVSGNNNLVVGQKNVANNGFNVVFGYDNDALVSSGYSLVGGTLSQTVGKHSIAVGYSCKAGQSDRWYSTALGYDSEATGTAAFAGGRAVWFDATFKTMAEADGSFAYGGGPRVYENAPNSVALGTITQCGEPAPSGGITAAQSMAIGFATKAYKDNSFAGGNQSYSFGDTSFSFGNGAVASAGYSNIALGRGVTTPVSGGAATTIGAVSVGQWNEFNVTTQQHFSVGTGTADGSRYTSMYVGPRSSANSGIVMRALKDSAAYSSDYYAGLGGVPLGGIYRTSSGYIRVRLS